MNAEVPSDKINNRTKLYIINNIYYKYILYGKGYELVKAFTDCIIDIVFWRFGLCNGSETTEKHT